MDLQRMVTRQRSPDAVEERGQLPLLTRLNQRGFRLLQAADVAVLLAVMLGTNLVRYGWEWPTYPRQAYFASFAFTTATFLGVFYFSGLYEREPRLGYPSVLPRVVRATLVAIAIIALFGYVTERALPGPSWNLVVLVVLGSLGLAVNRRVALALRIHREGPPRILLVGAPDEVNVALDHVRDDADRAVVVATASNPGGLLGKVSEYGVTDVMLLSSRWLDDLYPSVLDALERRRVTVLQRVTARETLYGLERVREVGGMPFVLLRAHTIPLPRARLKRVLETVGLVVTAPVHLAVLGLLALYVRVVAGRPVLFWQERVGRYGRPFLLVKFRTMRPDAEEDGQARLATTDDPRIIPACRWVRAMRLDELPQVWNVLRGEMSLVGPRPERPELTEQFERLIPGYSRRHEIPPGLTGLAQIHGRYDTDPEYKLGYDLQYLVNWSPVLDLQILVRTVWVVLARRI